MENQMGMLLIAGACGVVLVMGMLKGKAEWLLNITMRGILGTVAMYFVNTTLTSAGISLGIGINVVTVLTCGILGFPGFLALYGLGIYQVL